MAQIYLWLYQFSLQTYAFLIKIAAFWNQKAKQWIRGRVKLFDNLARNLPEDNHPIIWMHAASLGEFEQGRPLIEKIKHTHPNYFVLLTFYSPSGYEIRKNYEGADYITYLPLDTPQNARAFVELVRPKLVIWVKYEFWYFHLQALASQGIPVFLIAGIFRENHFFFKKIGRFHKKCLSFFTHFFLQNQVSIRQLKSIDFQNVSLVGDPRIDRVLAISKSPKSLPIIQQFVELDSRPIFIAGSTWQPDEGILSAFIHQHQDDFRYIIAPHEIHSKQISYLQNSLTVPSLKYSEATPENLSTFNVLIIDNIGMLSSLYQFGKIAYIGGAFGSGLHNILEPIVFGLPVVFGNRYQKFEEAVALVEQKGCFSISQYTDLEDVIKKLSHADAYQKASQTVLQYVEKNKGATESIYSFLKTKHYL